jgi:hypothetical protein
MPLVNITKENSTCNCSSTPTLHSTNDSSGGPVHQIDRQDEFTGGLLGFLIGALIVGPIIWTPVGRSLASTTARTVAERIGMIGKP